MNNLIMMAEIKQQSFREEAEAHRRIKEGRAQTAQTRRSNPGIGRIVQMVLVMLGR